MGLYGTAKSLNDPLIELLCLKRFLMSGKDVPNLIEEHSNEPQPVELFDGGIGVVSMKRLVHAIGCALGEHFRLWLVSLALGIACLGHEKHGGGELCIFFTMFETACHAICILKVPLCLCAFMLLHRFPAGVHC